MIMETAHHLGRSVYETFVQAYMWHNAHVSEENKIQNPHAVAKEAFKYYIVFKTEPKIVTHFCRYVNALKRQQRVKHVYQKKGPTKTSPASTFPWRS